MSSYFGVVVVGSRFLGIESKDLLSEHSFKLVPEPTNDYDPKAILVLKKGSNGFQPCGHVARTSQKEVPNLPPDGELFKVRTSYMESVNAVFVHFVFDNKPREVWTTVRGKQMLYYCDCDADMLDHCECFYDQLYDPDGLDD